MYATKDSMWRRILKNFAIGCYSLAEYIPGFFLLQLTSSAPLRLYGLQDVRYCGAASWRQRSFCSSRFAMRPERTASRTLWVPFLGRTERCMAGRGWPSAEPLMDTVYWSSITVELSKTMSYNKACMWTAGHGGLEEEPYPGILDKSTPRACRQICAAPCGTLLERSILSVCRLSCALFKGLV